MNVQRPCCRVFQGAFAPVNRMINTREPEVVSGHGAFSKLPALLSGRGVTNPLVVTGPRMAASEAFAAFAEALPRMQLFDRVQPDPPAPLVEEMADLYRAHRCDGIVAIGGGSPIDAAKAAGALVARPGADALALTGVLRVRRRLPLLVAVPTTAGTGSECTCAAVISDPVTGQKRAIDDPVLCPAIALLDPELTVSMPPSLTAQTGMDALTHAIEAYLNRAYHRPSTPVAALSAVRDIVAFLPRAYADGGDREARERMLVASYRAGVAFSVAFVGNVHAIAHALGGATHAPHGLACAVTLPYVLEEYLPAAERPLAELAHAAGIDAPTDGQAARALVERIRAMNADLGMPAHLEAAADADFPTLARWASAEANPLYPVPVTFDRARFEAVMRRVAGA